MTLADSPSISPIQRAHQGGFFWAVDRAHRIQTILDVASQLPKLVVITGSMSETSDVSERLTLRGLPVMAASDLADPRPVTFFDSTATVALVTTAEYIGEHCPIWSSMTIHLRLPFSVRSYIERLKCSKSAVHVTLVSPEDHQRSEELRSALSPHPTPPGDAGVDLTRLLDLATSKVAAKVETPRRRLNFRGVS